MGHLVYGRVNANNWWKTGFAKYLNPDNPLLPSFQMECPKTVKNRIQGYVEVYYWYINPVNIYWANSRLFQHTLLRTCRKWGLWSQRVVFGISKALEAISSYWMITRNTLPYNSWDFLANTFYCCKTVVLYLLLLYFSCS